jgi:hypothetical protein
MKEIYSKYSYSFRGYQGVVVQLATYLKRYSSRTGSFSEEMPDILITLILGQYILIINKRGQARNDTSLESTLAKLPKYALESK